MLLEFFRKFDNKRIQNIDMNMKTEDKAVPKGKLLIIGGKEDRNGTEVENKGQK